MVSLPGSQRVEQHQLRLSKGRENPQRKRERGLQRRGHNYLVNFRGGSGAKSSGATCLDKQVSCSGSCVSCNFSYVCRPHACDYSNSAICTAFKAAPFSN